MREICPAWKHLWLLLLCGSCHTTAEEPRPVAAIAVDGRGFVDAAGRRFIAWGFNYDHDREGRLLEDYWYDEWPTVESDFSEMKTLGANVVRIHLQLASFLNAPQRVNATALERLADLLALAERTGLLLDVTGLGCYHRHDIPPWFDVLDEVDRWEVQAQFWSAIAQACAGSPAIFCYGLMNEPILPGAGQVETDWLGDEFGGKHFVQRLTLDLRDRTREQVAETWVAKQVAAIRAHDPRRLITVGVIPWAHVFPGAPPLFYSPAVAQHLDFVSVHFYPKSGEIEKALKALRTYDIGKPLVIEEMFPLACSVEELDAFIEGSRDIASGWIGFYWGQTIEETRDDSKGIASAITRTWLEYARDKAPRIVLPPGRPASGR